MAYKVFVSYSTKDIPNVDTLRKFLQFPDVECFVSEYAVTPGAPLAPTIKNSILTCDLFVVLWSKNALPSEWVSQEIGIAHGVQKPILPFALEQGLSLPGFIKELRYVAAYQNPQQAMYSLRETVMKNSLMKQNQQAARSARLGRIVQDIAIWWVGKSPSRSNQMQHGPALRSPSSQILKERMQRHAGSDLETSRETRTADDAERLTRQRLRVSEAA